MKRFSAGSIAAMVIAGGLQFAQPLALDCKEPKAISPSATAKSAQKQTKKAGPNFPYFTDDGRYVGKFHATPARVLTFPNNLNYGGLIISSQANSGSGTNSRTYKAEGTLEIQPNKIVTFCPSINFYKFPHALDSMPSNSFDAVMVRYMSMDDSEEGKADPAVAALNRFTSITSLDLSKSEVSDKGICQLKNLVNVEDIDVFSTETNGKWIKELGNCKKIRAMRISHDSIDLAYLKYLCQYPELVHLQLSRINLTNEAVKSVVLCKSIQSLELQQNPDIDDNVIDTLLQLPNLTRLRLKGTSITAKGLAKLKAAGKLDTVIDLELMAASPEDIKKSRRQRHDDDSNFVKSIFSPMSRGRGL